MTCPFGQDDAAYVLGALSPAERLEFERHLVRCEDCTRAVRELAGIPGLLSRIDPDVLVAAPTSFDEPVPPSVLPRLARAARRDRRRRVAVAAGAAAAVAAVLAPVAVSQLDLGDPAPPRASDAVTMVAMKPVGKVPVVAELGLEAVTWGTRLDMTCTYDTGSVPYKLPPAVDYVIFVRTADGHAERVGSWRSVDGKTMRFTAGTAATAQDIASVEVRTVDGRVVLTRTT
jgi:hypothetical protein